MKTRAALASLIILLTGSSLTLARIGETEAQIEARYGKATWSHTIDPAVSVRSYSFSAFTVLVTFENGASVIEIYQKPDRSEISLAEVSSLVAANSEPGQTWRITQTSPEMVFWQKNRFATYNNASKQMTIAIPDALSRIKQRQSAADINKMRGF